MVNSGVQNRYVNPIAMGQSGLRLELFSDPDPLRPSLLTLATSSLGTYRQMMMRMRLNPLTIPGRRMNMELGRILARWPSTLDRSGYHGGCNHLSDGIAGGTYTWDGQLISLMHHLQGKICHSHS